MLSKDSIFRRLPARMERGQAVCLDGIRHAAEIADLAHTRLQQTLTELALTKAESPLDRLAYTSAFLDAWAFVGAIDRIGSLFKLTPGVKRVPVEDLDPIENTIGPIRKLRNIADHLGQRVDYVVSKNGNAFGSLAWITYTDLAARKGRACQLQPGTIPRQLKFEARMPEDHATPNEVTGRIRLFAGG